MEFGIASDRRTITSKASAGHRILVGERGLLGQKILSVLRRRGRGAQDLQRHGPERSLQDAAVLVHRSQARPGAEHETDEDDRGHAAEQRNFLANPAEPPLEGKRAPPHVQPRASSRQTQRERQRLGIPGQIPDAVAEGRGVDRRVAQQLHRDLELARKKPLGARDERPAAAQEYARRRRAALRLVRREAHPNVACQPRRRRR